MKVDSAHRETIAEAQRVVDGVKSKTVTLDALDRYQQWLTEDGITKLIDAARYFANTHN